MNKTVDDINQIRLTIFKALADPVRIRIINFLKTKEHEIACGVVAKEINIRNRLAPIILNCYNKLI